jgi:hypothetical protein
VVVMPDGVLISPLSRTVDNVAEERDRHRDDMMQNLMHSHQHILEILHIRVSCMFNLSNSI